MYVYTYIHAYIHIHTCTYIRAPLTAPPPALARALDVSDSGVSLSRHSRCVIAGTLGVSSQTL